MNKKYISIFKLACVSASAFVLLCGFAPGFSAASLEQPVYANATSVQAKNNKFFVGSSIELAVCANSISAGDEIILTNNICLDTKISFKSSCSLNLNGYTILVESDDEGIVIGEKEFSHTEQYTVTHPGYYTWDRNIKTVEHPNQIVTDAYGRVLSVPIPSTQEISEFKVWHPEAYETRYRDIYKYKNDVDVIIKNGTIKKSEGKDGIDGQKDVFIGYNGTDGSTQTAPIYVVSGTVRFYNTYVQGADGGNGGNGGYQSLVHIPLVGGGSAGNGGNGGNAGSAVTKESPESKVLKDDFSCLSAGKPGKGGKAGQPNSNYWVYSGWEGKDGKNGNDSSPVSCL